MHKDFVEASWIKESNKRGSKPPNIDIPWLIPWSRRVLGDVAGRTKENNQGKLHHDQAVVVATARGVYQVLSVGTSLVLSSFICGCSFFKHFFLC